MRCIKAFEARMAELCYGSHLKNQEFWSGAPSGLLIQRQWKISNQVIGSFHELGLLVAQVPIPAFQFFHIKIFNLQLVKIANL